MYAHKITTAELSRLVNRIGDDRYFRSGVPHVRTYSGLTLSVQAGNGLYSEPRAFDAEFYSEVEIGFPNRVVEDLKEYAEMGMGNYLEDGVLDDDDECYAKDSYLRTVYPYTPIDLAVKVINDNGGMLVGTLAGLVDLGWE